MTREGTLRQHFLKGGAFEDVEVYGLLASDRQADKAFAKQQEA